jgi:hypothetical protein
MGETRNEYKSLVRKLEGKRPLGNLGVDGKIILKCILKKHTGLHVRLWTGLKFS